jgi:hypothetical protein
VADETDNPTVADLLSLAIGRAQAGVRTCQPGIVLAYDPVQQKAIVQPAIRVARTDPTTGLRVYQEVPPIANCPVAHIGAGDFSLCFPLSPGDSVLLLVADRSMDEWILTGETKVDPYDSRRFDWMDCVVLPALRSFNPAAGARGPIPVEGVAAGAMVVRAPEIRLGSSAAYDALVLESLLPDLLAALSDVSAALTALGILAPALVNLTNLITALPGAYRTLKVKAE